MSIPKSALDDFIATVPSCLQTTRLSVVLEIFSQGQCDRLVVVSEQQCPIGVLYPARLMPHLISLHGCKSSLDVQQPLWTVGLALVEPIVTIPRDVLSVEQFGLYLRSQQSQTNAGSDWALVDSAGKFLGLLDSPRLLQFLAIQLQSTIAAKEQRLVGCSQAAARCRSKSPRHRVDIQGVESLVQLLELLPLPLMLQTSTGETVTQNSAWRRQFGAFDLDKVKQEVTVILEVSQPPQNGQELILEFLKIPLDRTQSWEVRSDREASASLPWSESEKSAGSKVSGVREPETLCLVLAQDITEQQQLASELAAKNADLIQLNRLKDEFLACISHELKTPLTTVIGLSTLLKDQALGQLNDRQARYAGLIHQSGRHLMTVVNDILDLTRMETGQMKLTLEPVEIETVCDRAIKQARAIQHNTSQLSTPGKPLPEHPCDHRFTLLIEPSLESFVADELRLSQMLVHLLSNAFKFTQADGEIGLRVNSWSGWIAFTVCDTGIGIPEQKQHLIFQKFQQLENPLTRQFQGAGLGLVLTRALARLHGGDVTFLSKEGKGSEFTLLLPPSPPQKRAGEALSGAGGDSGSPLGNSGSPLGIRGRGGQGEENSSATPYSLPATVVSRMFHRCEFAAATPQNHRNRLVLVVEAAPQFIEDLTDQLTSLGYLVVIARSGTEALEKVRRLQPRAVFLNPLLPLLSGWDVLTLLKSDATTRQIPVIVTATRAEKEQAFSNRADDFLSLPVQQQVLQQVLARCATLLVSQSGRGVSESAHNYTPLTILRLVTPHFDTCKVALDPLLLLNHRVLEADDLEQAELLAQFWQPDIVLLDKAIPDPLAYLKQLCQHPSLKDLPLVTLDAATTEAANKVTGLSVFPCLSPDAVLETDALLSVLQIAAGISWTPSLLVVDIATLPELLTPTVTSSLPLRYHSSHSLGFEWFQALIQYLQTAGFRGMMARSWAEVLQQIRQQSADLLLICLGEPKNRTAVLAALTTLGQLHKVPPVLVLDQRLSQGEVSKELRQATAESDAADSLETVLRAIATQILPPSISMEELLDHIHHTLTLSNQLSAQVSVK